MRLVDSCVWHEVWCCLHMRTWRAAQLSLLNTSQGTEIEAVSTGRIVQHVRVRRQIREEF
jgi:hypothetical protein